MTNFRLMLILMILPWGFKFIGDFFELSDAYYLIYRIVIFVPIILIIGFLAITVWEHRSNKKWNHPEPDEDRRPTFLALRSFNETALKVTEAKRTRVSRPNLILSLTRPFLKFFLPMSVFYDHKEQDGSSLLDILSYRLARYGRLIVIGVEGKEENNRDENDEYIRDFIEVVSSDQNWEERFFELAKSVKAIFIIPSMTKGLMMEINGITSSEELLRKTFIIMPPSEPSPETSEESWKEDTFINLGNIKMNWDSMQKILADQGYHLPDYEYKGLIYNPAKDLTVAAGQAIYFSGEITQTDINRVVEPLMPNVFGQTLILPLEILVEQHPWILADDANIK